MAAPLENMEDNSKVHLGQGSLRVTIETMGAFPKQDASDVILCLESVFSLVNQSCFNL